jgi:hypothetical protein
MAAAVLLVVAIVAVAAILGAKSLLGPGGCRTPEGCLVAVPDDATFVATRVDGATDAELDVDEDGSAALVTLRGDRVWRVATGSDQAPEILASGDVSGDGVTDYVLGLVRHRQRRCGSQAVTTTSFVVVDGRSGRARRLELPLADICWRKPTFTYPTRQWGAGTVYIGDVSPAHRGNELVAVPYYAKQGTVWNLAETGGWQRVRGAGGATSFPWPSTARFDQVYDASNPAPCSSPTGGGRCFVDNSHVANAVVLPGGAGLFALTSARAVIYRPDLTPTSDITWFPGGSTVNGGRNYGLVEAYRAGGTTYVDLLGGCSVAASQRAMREVARTSSDAECGITRHVERFAVRGDRITNHTSLYYGYAPVQGTDEGRIEYPPRPRAPLGGPSTSWTAYNVRRGGTWAAQVLQGPMTTSPVDVAGWFVWATVPAPGGGASLLASRVTAGAVVPHWGFDVLRWNGSAFGSVKHVDGAVPALVSEPSTPTLHTSEQALSATTVRGGQLLVVGQDGSRRMVSISDGRS